jgi:CheY-like chemotaxis protein
VESLAGGAAHGGRDQAGQASVGAPDRPVAPAAMITLLVVDDHPGFRGTLEAVLSSARDLFGTPPSSASRCGTRGAGSSSDGREAVALARETTPDVVLMDLEMPGLNGIQATQALAADGSAAPALRRPPAPRGRGDPARAQLLHGRCPGPDRRRPDGRRPATDGGRRRSRRDGSVGQW